MSARCMKTSLNANAAAGHTISDTTKNGASPIDTTHYVLDAAGNIMAVYRNKEIEEQPIYGSARIGEYAGKEKEGYQTFNLRKYELTNHLGNVMAVISDKVNLYGHNNVLDSARATVMSASDYYPGGMLMPGRVFSSKSYRYKHQGQESDMEIYGEGESYTYKYRMSDPRLVRFWSVDPLYKKYPFWSTYAFSGNRLIDSKELEGLEPERVTETATDYEGTPYEYGGKEPAFKNALPKGMSEKVYLEQVGEPSSARGGRRNNPNYTNKINLNQYLIDGATSCGIDCSGLAATAFNADEQRLMPEFSHDLRSRDQRSEFSTAEGNNTGYLGSNFQNISQGDLVFNGNETNNISHVMVATGQTRTNEKGQTQIEITHSPRTGKYVETTWSTVGRNWSYGHTFRTTDNILSEVNVKAKRQQP